MKRSPHPARRARRITALVSGASYLGLTGSIAAATALANRADEVAAELPDVAPDTTEDQQNLPLVLDGEATPAASTTLRPEPSSSIDLFASSVTTGAEMTASSAPASTPATTAGPTASTTVATTRPPSTTVTTTQATTVTTTTSTLASTTTEPATTSSVATSASTEPTSTTTTTEPTTTTTEATTTTTEATTTTSEAS